MLVFAATMPHPIESIPEIGNKEDRKKIKKTLDAFEQLRIAMEDADPNTIIIISPHAHLDAFSFNINAAPNLRGSFYQFDFDKIYEFENNLHFSDKLAFCGSISELPTHLHETLLDYGALIPLVHLTKNIKPKVVHLSFSLMSYERHFRYGQAIKNLIDKGDGGRVAVIASADLSHKLAPNAPAGFDPEALNFDKSLLYHLGNEDETSIMSIHEDEARKAAECGLRSIIILLGILHGAPHKFNLLSYENPFGVGYLTARFV